MIPEKVAVPALSVNVAPPSATLPLPPSAPTVLLKPARSSVAPALTVIPPVVLPNACVDPACSVPALTVVRPVYLFVPESTNVPAPSLRRMAKTGRASCRERVCHYGLTAVVAYSLQQNIYKYI